ncbi:polymorphic toxin-type HINT domain-containing protein [Psychrobacter lutiphocae]|uniref:polymorphic toxin-type HINT domain-containing protein n=1 Tax=Psychrobacter lutiphocae TaxID=540500 RepID=UPI003908BB03
MAGMKFIDRNNDILTVVSQTKLDKTDTVYNFEVDEFHTYHIGEFGVWVHNSCYTYLKNTEIPKFTVNSTQLGRKLGKHVQDFGGDVTKKADRDMITKKINDIGNNPDKVITGTFSGQGVNGGRGDVLFFIKGNDVVVTKPNGEFVTILKDGVTSNTSVKTAIAKAK